MDYTGQNCQIQLMYMDLMTANSADPDEMLHNQGHPLVITIEIMKGRVILPKHSSYRTSALGRVTRGNITPLCSLLHTLSKDKCMCLQDK